MEKNLQAHQTQINFLLSNARFRAYVGGIRSGKTVVGSMAMLKELQSGGLGMIVAPTFPMLRDSTLRTFKDIAGDIISEFNVSEMRAVLRGGGEVLFRSADNPERLRGATLKAFWVDEAAQCDEDTWTVGVGRLSVAGARGWITTTPQGKAHWTYRIFAETEKPDYALFHSTSFDNPFLPKEYLDSVSTAFVGSYARQELYGDFVSPEGALFQRDWFRLVEPDAPELKDVKQWVRAWDLALTTKDASDRTASLICGYDSHANLFLRDGIAFKAEYPEVKARIIQQAKIDGVSIPLVVERVAFQLAAVQELMREPDLLGHRIIPDEPDRDKISRLRPLQSRAANGQVYLVRGAWVNDFLDETTSIVADMSHKHDDYADAWSAAVKYLRAPEMVQSLGFRPQPDIFEQLVRLGH